MRSSTRRKGNMGAQRAASRSLVSKANQAVRLSGGSKGAKAFRKKARNIRRRKSAGGSGG